LLARRRLGPQNPLGNLLGDEAEVKDGIATGLWWVGPRPPSGGRIASMCAPRAMAAVSGA
jgi:hypothetical protein